MDENNISFEPMDIDLSGQSIKDMDISYNDPVIDLTYSRSSSRNSDIFYNLKDELPVSTPYSKDSDIDNYDIVNEFPRLSRLSSRRISAPMDQLSCNNTIPANQPVIKKFHIVTQKTARSNKSVLKILATVVIIFISIITYHLHCLHCCDNPNLEILNETLSNRLYGQSVAVELIIQTLDLKAKNKILFFSGGTGVGKSFTSSLLLDTLDSCSNVYHYTMPTFEDSFSNDVMYGLTMCKTSLVVVDDLTVNDMDVKVHIQYLIGKGESLDKDITVILIFNCNEDFHKKCDESFKSKLLNNFSDIKALKKFIKFEPLSEENLKECIMQELGNKKLNDQELEDIVRNFNVSVDGCKGVHSKMKYLNIV